MVFLLLFLSNYVLGQLSLFAQSGPNSFFPTVKTGQTITVTLDQLNIKVAIVGNFAITTYDMTFKNGENRILEGQLSVPLQQGENVIGYQLEVNGSMRKGVVVEKAEARQVFEEVVNRRVDPGIVEKTQGNNYRTRLYPIPANGLKRVIITTQQQLLSNQSKCNYTLPFSSDQKLSKFSLLIEVFQSAKPQMDPNSLGNIDFQNIDNIYRLRMDKENYAISEPIKFSIPDQTKLNVSFFEKNGNDLFFTQTVSNPTDGTMENDPLNKVSGITILWDLSLSGLKRNSVKELSFIQTLIQKNNQTPITLITFSDRILKKYSFKAADFESIQQTVQGFVYDGTSDLSILNTLKINPDHHVFIMSDGMNGLGHKEMKALNNNHTYAIVSGMSNNYEGLALLTQNNILNINKISVEDAVTKILGFELKITKIEVVSGTFADLYPGINTKVNDQITVSGKIIGNSGVLKLFFNKGEPITLTIQYNANQDLSQKGEGISTLISRYWAQNKLDELMINMPKNKNRVQFLAKKYGIVTPYTSLIVLENLSDYLRYNIEPPQELKTEYDQYLMRVGKQTQREVKTLSQDEIIEQNYYSYYQPLLLWWKIDFQAVKSVPKKQTYNPSDTINNIPVNRSLTPDTLRNGSGIIQGVIKTPDEEPHMYQLVKLYMNTNDEVDLVVTNEEGFYIFYNVSPGIYSIVAGNNPSCSGKSEATNIELDSNQQITVDFELDCGNQLSYVILNSNSTVSDYNTGETTIVDGVTVRNEQVIEVIDNDIEVESSYDFSVDYNENEAVSDYIPIEVIEESDEEPPLRFASAINQNDTIGNIAGNVNNNTPSTKTITLKKYNPDENYLKAFEKATSNQNRYHIYLQQRDSFLNTPSYFVDIADHFYQNGMVDTAIIILSNILEITNEESQIVQIYGKKLTEYKAFEKAVDAFTYITVLREEFPQSYRDLALAYQYNKEYQNAYDMFLYILTRTWTLDDEIKPIVFTEFNNLLNLYGNKINSKDLNPKLRAEFPVGIRVVISWDTDNSDMDLHVTEPNGKTCMYNYPLTPSGGKISRDFTRGFGPEQYMMKKTLDGYYVIKAHYFGSQSQSQLMPVSVYADVFLDYGTKKQTHQRLILRLNNKNETFVIGEIDVQKPDQK